MDRQSEVPIVGIDYVWMTGADQDNVWDGDDVARRLPILVFQRINSLDG